MKQKFNKEELGFQEQRSVWEVNIRIHSAVDKNSIQAFEKAKKMKIKIILN